MSVDQYRDFCCDLWLVDLDRPVMKQRGLVVRQISQWLIDDRLEPANLSTALMFHCNKLEPVTEPNYPYVTFF